MHKLYKCCHVCVCCYVNVCIYDVVYNKGIECGDVIGGDGEVSLGAHLRVAIVSREVGGRAVFSCAPGFGLRGPHETICQSTGDWAQPFPTCSGKQQN